MAEDPDVFALNVEEIRKFAHNPLFDLIDVPTDLTADEIYDQPRFLEDASIDDDDFLALLRKRLFTREERQELAAEEAIPLASKIGFVSLLRRTTRDLRRTRTQMAADQAGEMQGIASSNGVLKMRVETGTFVYPAQLVNDDILSDEEPPIDTEALATELEGFNLFPVRISKSAASAQGLKEFTPEIKADLEERFGTDAVATVLGKSQDATLEATKVGEAALQRALAEATLLVDESLQDLR